jgi:hypothetical protein
VASPERRPSTPDQAPPIESSKQKVRRFVVQNLDEIFRYSYKGYILTKNFVKILCETEADPKSIQDLCDAVISKYQNSISRKLWVDDIIDHLDIRENESPLQKSTPKLETPVRHEPLTVR